MSKIKKYYNSLGKVSRTIFKCTLLLSAPLILLSLLSDYADFTPYQYRLLIISDELLSTARSVLATGLIGTIILNSIEKTE